jgi:DNA-binding transcriptional regulator YdaS (Cro superfamily)
VVVSRSDERGWSDPPDGPASYAVKLWWQHTRPEGSGDTMSEPTVPQHLLELARRARVPEALSPTGLNSRFGEPANYEVATSQVWRARWDAISVLVLILGIEDRTVHVVPVTLDLPAEDERSLIVEPGLTTFGIHVTVWVGLAGDLPSRVLEQPVDLWPDELVHGIANLVHDPAASVPTGTRRGDPITSDLAPEALLRAELEDDLESLRQAPALPVAADGEDARPLSAVLGRKVDLKALVAALGWPQHEVMNLLNGRRALTPEEVGVVADATGVSPEEVAKAVRLLPPDFVAEVEQPRWRSTWRHRADRDGTDETTARLRQSYDMFARAARQTGGGPDDWRARLEQYRRRSFQREMEEE